MQIRILPLDDSTALPIRGGTAARLAGDASAGMEPHALSAPPAGGAQLTDAALYIDQSTTDLTTHAKLQWWHTWWWGYPAYTHYPAYYPTWSGWGWWGC